MIRFIKRYWVICLLLFLILYLLVGATAPFLSYREITEETGSSFDTEAFRTGTTGPERAALVETNMDAWKERMRLLSQARERIILSTFDMRPGESTCDILSVLLAKAEEGVNIRILVDGISGAICIDDDISVVGSYNLDLRSTYVDTELMLVVESRQLNQELAGYLSEFQTNSRKIIDADTYEVPEDFQVRSSSAWKHIAWAVFGLVIQPFRCLI